MLVAKSFLVTGDTKYRDGKPVKDIADNVDQAINAFLSDLDGAALIDIKPNVQISQMSDVAFITIIVDMPKGKRVVEDESADVAVVKKKK